MRVSEAHERSDQVNVSHFSVIYIGGYGRSGSTILGTLLGSGDDVVHLGELACLRDDWANSRRRCSCGELFPECPQWSQLQPESALSSDDWRVLRRLEHLASLPRLAVGLVSRREKEVLDRYARVFLSTVSGITGSRTLVDSSKTARAAASRPLALARYGHIEVKIVHLTRSGTRCLQSLLRTGSNWELEGRDVAGRTGPIRNTLGWLMANLAATLIGRLFFRHKYYRLRFEELLENPLQELTNLESWLGVDLDRTRQRLTEGDVLDIGHVLGGNRLRFQSQLRFDAVQSREPVKLSRSERLTFLLLAGWLNRLYGYRH